RKYIDCLFFCLLRQKTSNLPFNRWLDQSFITVSDSCLQNLYNRFIRTFFNHFLFKISDQSLFWWNNRRSEEHTSELQSRFDLVCRLLLEKKNRVTRSVAS